MNNFLYAMVESFDNMNSEINRILDMTVYDEKEKREIFFTVGTCLHWILDYAERIDISEQDKRMISAFRYANNSLKHSIEVKKITEEIGGFEFPIEFPFESSEREVVWAIVDNGDKENQKKNYRNLLEGKDVIETCGKMVETLRKYEL